MKDNKMSIKLIVFILITVVVCTLVLGSISYFIYNNFSKYSSENSETWQSTINDLESTYCDNANNTVFICNNTQN